MRSVSRSAYAAVSGVLALLWGSQALATQYLVTSTGIIRDGLDETGVVGPANTSLDGVAYTLSMMVNTDVGTVDETGQFKFYNSQMTSPSLVTAQLTILGTSFDIQGVFDSEVLINHGGSSWVFSQDTQHFPDAGNGPRTVNAYVNLQEELHPSDIDDFGVSNCGPFQCSGVFEIEDYVNDHNNLTYSRHIYAAFTPSSISVTSVPEPGAWALLLAGFAATGLLLRRRRPLAG